MSAQTTSVAARNRRFFLLIVTIFVLPAVLAWLLVGSWRPSGSVHHGELLNPARPITDFRAQAFSGEPLSQEFLRTRWTLAYIVDPTICTEECRTTLYHMRQIRLALGKDMLRAQNVFLVTVEPHEAFTDWLGREHQEMVKATVDAGFIAFVAEAFPEASPSNSGILLIDPLGNLVMRYAADVTAGDILKDLRRLFKYSRIG